jgi:FAD/FMN-containing dehydrogenase
MPYTAMQRLLDPLWPAGAHNYFTSALLDRLTDETIDALLASTPPAEHPSTSCTCTTPAAPWPGSPPTPPRSPTVTRAYVVNIIARSPDRAGFEQHADWARATHQAIGPWSTGGGYVNFTSEPGQDQVQASYPPDTHARLVAVKDRYDPTNLFQLNQNIRPTGHR